MAYPLAYIIWVDSCFLEHGWTPLDDVDADNYIIHSVGFLVDETDEYFIISTSWVPRDNEMVHSPFQIPKVCVLKYDIMNIPIGEEDDNE